MEQKYWSYDPVTNYLNGEGKCDEDPKTPGSFLIPAFATTQEPPKYKEGVTIAKWEINDINTPWNGSWVLSPVPSVVVVPEEVTTIEQETQTLKAIISDVLTKLAALELKLKK